MRLAEIVADVKEAIKELGYEVYDSPPESFMPPAAIVELPNGVTYHGAFKGRELVELTVTFIVVRVDAKDARAKLYAALSTESSAVVSMQPIQPALEAYPGRWRSLTVTTADTFGTYSLGPSTNGNGLAGQLHLSVRARAATAEEGS